MSEVCRCKECGADVVQRLVVEDGKPKTALACECYVFHRTQGRHVPFSSDLPERWCDE